MIKCPDCKNESIKIIKRLGITIYYCIFKNCGHRLTIDLINNKVYTNKNKAEK